MGDTVEAMTVATAGRFHCPASRVLDGRSEAGLAAVNRLDLQGTHCLGACCAKWLWLEPPVRWVTVPAGTPIDRAEWVEAGEDDLGRQVFVRVIRHRPARCGLGG